MTTVSELNTALFVRDHIGQLRPLRWMTADQKREHRDDIYLKGDSRLKRNKQSNAVDYLQIAAELGSYEARRQLALLYAEGNDISSDHVSSYYWEEYWLFHTDIMGLEEQLFENAYEILIEKWGFTTRESADICSNTLKVVAETGYLPAIYEVGRALFFYGQDRALGLAWARLAVQLNLDNAKNLFNKMKETATYDLELAAASLYKELVKKHLALGKNPPHRLSIVN